MLTSVKGREQLDALYNDILTRHKSSILSGGQPDRLLSSPERDTRMSVALVFRIPNEICSQIQQRLSFLKAIEPDLYFYPSADFHVTVLDILAGKPDLQKPNKDTVNSYVKQIQAAALGVDPFSVSFEGFTASSDAVMVKGYYTQELTKIRDALRTALPNAQLAFEERYRTSSCHITVARLSRVLNEPSVFLNFIEKNQRTDFGSFTVQNLELIYHNWYDSNKEILARIPF